MQKEFNVLTGYLTAYQLSEALDISIEKSRDILSDKNDAADLNEELREKLVVLESALFESYEDNP